jgi:aspartate kinase
MKVFKFGGASVNNVERIRNVRAILQSFSDEKIFIVVSAIGKTTNALEKVAEAFYQDGNARALELFAAIKDSHLDMARQLIGETATDTENALKDVFTEVEWLIHDRPVREFNYYYDQIVCCGELLSSIILSGYLNHAGVSNNWIDVRDVLRTDNNFRDAAIDWSYTAQKTAEDILPLFGERNIVVSQGFIGATSENESTTLGREGSDYTAAVFANLLAAESLTIWKDVEGVMNADPKAFPNAVFIRELNYDEVIEMAYYGAQVIHPKTIKPLQNKQIPLYVKCFLDPALPGTVIHNRSLKNLPPIIVLKGQQALLHLHTKDFSFIGEKPIAELYNLLAEIRIKPNLIQTGAVSVHVCIDDAQTKVEQLGEMAMQNFDVHIERELTMITIRHYTNEVIAEMTGKKNVRLRQQTPETAQFIIDNR